MAGSIWPLLRKQSWRGGRAIIRNWRLRKKRISGAKAMDGLGATQETRSKINSARDGRKNGTEEFGRHQNPSKKSIIHKWSIERYPSAAKGGKMPQRKPKGRGEGNRKILGLSGNVKLSEKPSTD